MSKLFASFFSILLLAISNAGTLSAVENADDGFLFFSLQEQQASVLNTSLFLEDVDSKLNAAEVLQLERANFLTYADLNRSGWGFTNSSIWVKTEFVVEGDGNSRSLFIGSQRPDLGLMHLHVFDGQNLLVQKRSGSTVDPEDRPGKGRLPLVEVELPTNQKLTAVVQLRSSLQLNLSILFMSVEAAQSLFDRVDFTFVMYFSFLGGLIGFNFMLFILLRYKDYFLYCVFGLSMVLNSLSQAGFLEYFPDNPFLNGVEDSLYVICLPPMAALLYARSFLKLAEIAPRLDFVLKLGILICIICALIVPLPFITNLNPWVNLANAICFILIIVAGVYASLRRDPAAYTFTLAWGIFTVAAAYWSLGNIGIVEKTYFVAFSPLFGNMIEMILMAIALAIRIKQVEKGRRDALIKAKEGEQLKRLIRVLCHDINNPLSVIIGSIWSGRRRSQDPNASMKVWDQVDRACKAIEQIINQVKQYEALRSGEKTITMESVSIKKVFDEVQFFFREKAADKDVGLQTEIESPDGDLWVEAESVALSHVVIANLVSNAIKFSDKNGMVSMHAKGIQAGRRIEIRVKDEGIGMPTSLLSKVFDPSANTARRGTSKESGTGFGMPLVKSYVESFGGEIEVDSVEAIDGSDGHGTTIFVRLRSASEKPSTDPAENISV